jgi:hypothetical protein
MTEIRTLGLALGCLALFAVTAPAANLDTALIKHAPDVLKGLQKAKVKVVGILPFQVKRGTRMASFTDSPLSSTLPGRLETALIVRNPGEANEIMIVRGVPRGAAWSVKEEALKKLFAAQYEPAWGEKDKMKSEGFLTGTVTNDGNRKTTKIEVALVTPASWKDGKFTPTPLASFDVKTDHSLLRDLGYNVAVFASRALKTGLKKDDLDGDSIERVGQEEKGEKKEPGPKEEGSHRPDDISGMKFEVEYDGVKQEIKAVAGTADGAKQTTFEVPAPRPGQKVVMYLTRVSDAMEKLGVVMKINGMSTFDQQQDEPLACRKWIFSPEKKGKRMDFKGWYSLAGEKKLVLREFKVLKDDEEAEKALELGVRAGWIDIDVFTTREKEDTATDELTISTRGMTRGRAKTLLEARQALAKLNRMELPAFTPRGGLVFPDVNPVPAGKVSREQLPNPVRLGGISIRYATSPTE